MAEAFAEGRGRAQADTLRAMRQETVARLEDGTTKQASELAKGDVVVVEAGELIPGDGTVIEGIASVDESAITGESAPVIRESGGDRSAVTGGTRVLSDRIVVEITQEPGQSFLDRMIALVEGAARRKTPNEIALNILLAGLTLIFMIVVATLRPFGLFADTSISETTLISLLVALIPTTIGALLSAIGIAGMDRLVRRNVLALSGRAVEASGDVDVLLLDKTGTITIGNRLASEFIPMPGVSEAELAEVAQLASLADETPEGRSIVVLAKQYGIREHDMAELHAEFVPFTAQTRMSGVNLDGRQLRKGAGDAVIKFVTDEGGRPPAELQPVLDRIGREGGTPLAVARDSQVMGVIYLKDTIKEGMRERFDHLRAMGIRTIMITGDNRLTAAKIAEESGVDDFLAEATPEAKLALIKEQQAQGRHGGDDRRRHQRRAGARPGRRRRGDEHRHPGRARGREHGRPRLQPDEAHRDRRGRQAAADHPRRADHVLDRQRRRQVLRDPARRSSSPPRRRRKGGQGPLHVLNIMNLGTPRSAVISAIIFNAIVIPLLIPIALRGVRYRPIGASALLRRNLLDLRPRRDHRPVHRDQADRPDRPQPARGVRSALRARRHHEDVQHRAGHHKIFLGMAAGVGKTYRMLQEGQAEAETGRDVVIGYLEPHGRAETVAQAEGLEIVPRRRVAYRDTVLEEMDLPAILRRAARSCA